MWFDYEVCDLFMKYADWLHGMLVVVLNVNFIHFYHFHPYPSPRPGKCCQYQKRPEIALCGCITLFYRHMIPNGVIYGIIEQKFENCRSESTGQNWICSTLRITHIAFFSKHNLPQHSKHHLPYLYNLPIIIIFTTIISILQYCYHIVTIL